MDRGGYADPISLKPTSSVSAEMSPLNKSNGAGRILPVKSGCELPPNKAQKPPSGGSKYRLDRDGDRHLASPMHSLDESDGDLPH